MLTKPVKNAALDIGLHHKDNNEKNKANRKEGIVHNRIDFAIAKIEGERTDYRKGPKPKNIIFHQKFVDIGLEKRKEHSHR